MVVLESLIIFLQAIQIEVLRKGSLTSKFFIISLYFVLGKLLKLRQSHINKPLKNYSIVVYEETLKKLKFPNYEKFINTNEAYSKFIQKLTSVIDKIAP